MERPAFYLGNALSLGRSPLPDDFCHWSLAKNPFNSGELSLPLRVVRISRLDRQTRYYSDEVSSASGSLEQE